MQWSINAILLFSNVVSNNLLMSIKYNNTIIILILMCVIY